MLQFKGISYRRRDLVPRLHRYTLAAMGFPGRTVPALRIGSAQAQSTAEIARILDAAEPGQPLMAVSDDQQARAIEDAVGWACEVLGPIKEYLFWWGLERDRSAVQDLFDRAQMGIVGPLMRKGLPALLGITFQFDPSTDDEALGVLLAVPATLGRIDDLIDDGVVGNRQANAADFHLAALTRLLMTFDDLRPAIATRPAGRHAARFCPPLEIEIASIPASEPVAESFSAARSAILSGQRNLPDLDLPDSRSCGLAATLEGTG